MSRRLLLLGTTGVEKAHALSAVGDFREESAQARNFEYRDLEADHILPLSGSGMPEFLDAPEELQVRYWEQGARNAIERVNDRNEDNVVLGVHGVLVRYIYGTRSLVDLDAVRAFDPTDVVTLIDDVYLQWWRTEKRAKGLEYRGRPEIRQLIDARRAELLVADLICRNVNKQPSVRNWLMAVRHPARLLDRVFFSEVERLIPIYASFPISEPRRMQGLGDNSGIDQVNDFLRALVDAERERPHVACFVPLSIDELPLIRAWKAAHSDDEEIDFTLSDRWDVNAFYGDNDRLMNADQPDEISIPSYMIGDAQGMIRGDVAVRDYRLVAQARRLAVFNPVFNGELSRGVDAEIAYALNLRGRPVHIYQDPSYDTAGIARNRYQGAPGALGGRVGEEYVTFHDSVSELIEAVTSN